MVGFTFSKIDRRLGQCLIPNRLREVNCTNWSHRNYKRNYWSSFDDSIIFLRHFRVLSYLKKPNISNGITKSWFIGWFTINLFLFWCLELIESTDFSCFCYCCWIGCRACFYWTWCPSTTADQAVEIIAWQPDVEREIWGTSFFSLDMMKL